MVHILKVVACVTLRWGISIFAYVFGEMYLRCCISVLCAGTKIESAWFARIPFRPFHMCSHVHVCVCVCERHSRPILACVCVENVDTQKYSTSGNGGKNIRWTTVGQGIVNTKLTLFTQIHILERKLCVRMHVLVYLFSTTKPNSILYNKCTKYLKNFVIMNAMFSLGG